MPLKDDLIERTLEQLAEVVRDLTKVHQRERAEAFLQGAYQEHTGTDASLLKQLPSEQLLGILSSAGTVDREKAFLMGALFQAEAQVQLQQGVSGTAWQLKALDLHLEAALAELDLDEVDTQISFLVGELSAFALPAVTEWRLFEYARFRGAYAEAEDRLYALLEQQGYSEVLAQKGNQFYQTLLNTPLEKLESGGLPRAEVVEGLASFEAELADLK